MGRLAKESEEYRANAALTAAFVAGAAYLLGPSGASAEVTAKQAVVSLACTYTGGTASTGRFEILVEWRVPGGTNWMRPAIGAVILSEIADSNGDRNNTVSVENPGGMGEVRFSFREVGDVANPGSLQVDIQSEYAS